MLHAILFPAISPDMISVEVMGRTLAIKWYAMAYIVGILIGWRISVAAVRRPHLWAGHTPPMTAAQVEELLTAIILGIILGGRLGYVLFYQPGYYLEHPAEILAIWTGGMSFHGGLLGVITACAWFTRRRGAPFISTADMLCLSVPPGLLLGRIANFINAELWGAPTTLPWGVIFPGARAQACDIVLESGLCARHPSQLYEAALEGLLLGAILLWLAFRRGALRRPGLVTGVFFAGYGIARFLVEFVREPDAQFVTPENPFGHVALGMHMGQLLSLPMIALGLGFLLYALRRKPAPA